MHQFVWRFPWIQVTWELQKIFGLDPWIFLGIIFFCLPPTQDASHHQDYYIFSRESRTKPSFATVTGWGVDPRHRFSCFFFDFLSPGSRCFSHLHFANFGHQKKISEICTGSADEISVSHFTWWRMMTSRWPVLPYVFPPCERTQNPSPWRRRRGGSKDSDAEIERNGHMIYTLGKLTAGTPKSWRFGSDSIFLLGSC